MPIPDIDFTGTGSANDTNPTPDNSDVNPNANPANEPDSTPLNHDGVADVTGKDNNNNPDVKPDTKPDTKPEGGEGNDGNPDDSSTGELEVGTSIEFEGATYTVAENGDLVDAEGKVFKKADEVKAWLEGYDTENNDDTNDELSVESLQQALGIQVTDDEGKPLQFTNDAAGVKGYVEAVMDLKSKEIQEGTINKFFAENPVVKQFVDYMLLNDGDPRGFGEIPDRSGIKLEQDNEAQQIAIIQMAAREFGNKSLNENYINYLRSTGSLYDEAKSQLNALVQKDNEYRKTLEERARVAREEEQQAITDYWNNVSKAITNRVINGYKLPESFTKVINGQKITRTPSDFYNYLSRATETDEEGNRMTGYQRDLSKLSNEELLNKEILDAWLMYTGGSYKDLADMAVQEANVKKLIVKSKQERANRTIKITKPKQSKVSPDDILL